MKNAKKILALLLALVMVVSTIVVFADEVKEEEETKVEATETVVETTGTEAGATVEAAEEAKEETKEEATEEAAEEVKEEAAEVVAIAETKADAKVYEVKAANIGDYLKNKDDWDTSAEKEFEVKNNKIVAKSAGTQYIANKTESFNDALVQAKMSIKFTKPEGGSTWGGIMLRGATYTAEAWKGGNSGYLVVIKSDRIELQRFGKGGQKILTVVPNEVIKDGVAANISAAAVNAENGVNIVMFVEDKCVLNVFDSDENAIKEGKYFVFYATEGTEIAAFDGKAIPSIPGMLTAAGEGKTGGKFTASYSLISFGGEAKDEGYTINWTHSMNESGESLTELDNAAKKEFGSKYAVVGEYKDLKATGAEYTVKAEEVGGYFVATVKDAAGNVLTESKPAIVNNAQYILNESVALLIDCEYAFIKGEKVQIDPDDYNVMPSIVDGRTLVPVRFVAESFGAEVGWDGATRKITIKMADKEIIMTLGEKKYTVNGAEAELDVPAQVMSERTMVPVRVISEAFGKTVFWDGANSLIIISDKDLGLNSEADKESLAFIFDKIQDRI